MITIYAHAAPCRSPALQQQWVPAQRQTMKPLDFIFKTKPPTIYTAEIKPAENQLTTSNAYPVKYSAYPSANLCGRRLKSQQKVVHLCKRWTFLRLEPPIPCLLRDRSGSTNSRRRFGRLKLNKTICFQLSSNRNGALSLKGGIKHFFC